MTRALFHGLCLLLLLAGFSAPAAAQSQPGATGEAPIYDDNRGGGSLLSLFRGSGDELLPPEQAFPFSAELVGDDVIIARWNTADGYYLYRDRLSFQVQGADIAGYELPAGEQKDDPNFGAMEVYYGRLEVYIRLAEPAAGDVVLTAGYQGCADSGLCYPPMHSEFDMAGGTRTAGVSSGGGGGGMPLQAGDRLGALLSGGNLPLILAGFFSAGLLLAFTACLYPLIPILSGIIAGDARRNSGRALLLSLIFVQATALTYALAGVAAGLSGSAIQADLQSPWVLGSFAAVFVALAMAMFGVFTLQMPAAVQTRLDNLARRQRGGTFIGAGIMGMLSALIVGACSGPALVAALVFISNTGDAWLGGLALFAMGNGLGLPLLLLGTAAGHWLPRAGPWMVTVRRVFGIVFLGVAIWMLDRFIPDQVTLGLWAALLIGTAVWLGGPLRAASGGLAPRARLFVSAVLVIWGAVLLVGAASGGHSFWQPLQPLVQGTGQQQSVSWQKVATVDELQAAVRRASADGRSVMLDVYADWCIYCVQLEQSTFPDPAVRQATADSLKLKVDVTAMNSADKALLSHLNVFLPPAVIFYGPDGHERRDYRVIGFMPPEEFSRVAGHALRTDTL
ncbi:MAG: protein-disulfide reductase DsbD [Aquisalimonadaceae bacterium]